jgi:hypothetical protein
VRKIDEEHWCCLGFQIHTDKSSRATSSLLTTEQLNPAALRLASTASTPTPYRNSLSSQSSFKRRSFSGSNILRSASGHLNQAGYKTKVKFCRVLSVLMARHTLFHMYVGQGSMSTRKPDLSWTRRLQYAQDAWTSRDRMSAQRFTRIASRTRCIAVTLKANRLCRYSRSIASEYL